MKIGITVDIRHSIFSAGHPNSCIAIAEAFQVGGHDVVFLKRDQEKSWWDDVKALEADAPKCLAIDTLTGIDLVIEVAFLLTPVERLRFGRTVWYCRKPVIFEDLEATVFACREEGRDLEGLSEIWVADIFNNTDDLTYLKNLYSIPVRVVPWLWSPTIVEAHRKEKQSPVWKQVKDLISKETDKKTMWSLHITETNTSNTSSCVIPIVILKEFINSSKDCIEKISIHNTDHIAESKYFKENILDNCKIEAKLVGRQRIIDWTHEPYSIILSHSRFVPLKMANLEAAWVGLPLIHNNTVLRDFGCGLEKTYYENNSIENAVDAIGSIIRSIETIPYLNSLESLTELRTKILYRFSPEARAKEWLAMLTYKPSVSLINEDSKVDEQPSSSKRYTILFTDMWDQFNPAYNMFILAFREALEGIEINGYSLNTLPQGLKHDIHIFGPFGELWKRIEGPKVHYTGENTDPVTDKSVILNIGFNDIDNPSYFRLPIWMLGINWFNSDSSKLAEMKNPLPLPLEACTTVKPSTRSKFCAFIVSNPKNTIRNQAFHALTNYKKVDSAGKLYNNVGNGIFAGLGGGGGELKKYEFLKDYKFCLCYENESSDGYVTEKLLHAKAAGCIPIYWGASDVAKDFDERGFINLTECPEDLVARVKEIDESDELYTQMVSIPAIKPERIAELKSKFSDLVQRILGGHLLVTFATQKFWPSLIRWLDAVKLRMTSISDIKVRVYLGHDVIPEVLEATKEKYKFVSFIKIPTETPPGFDDFWAPQHYAWKLWIFKDICEDPRLKGSMVLYTDCGSVLIRWPTEWIKETRENKICFLEDSSQTNQPWCHSSFCSRLQVTDTELHSNQIWAGGIAFMHYNTGVTDFFAEAYRLACIRDVIVGEKWIVGSDNNVSGHRHDQSILSILSLRKRMKRFPLEKVYNHDSARSTYFGGQSIYVHRGEYKSHIPYMSGIDEVYIINLDRRPDRRSSFIENHPYFKGKVKRHMACDGLSLTLTPALAKLFKPNDFFWKKAVMGCAISHLKLWTMLQTDSQEMKTYLIMEDDARMNPEWTNAWAKVQGNLPVGWECIYLGGVLPPNKQGFELVKEPVIDGLCRIKPNTLFGQAEATRQFHFCTYAYILSRAGAKKLLDTIVEHNGIWTSADHVLFNSLDKMNVYCLDPLVAGASQDDDPAYINSDFNDFSRKDKFDSDLWNNDERFSSDEVAACLSLALPLQLAPPLQEIYEPIQKAQVRFLSLDTCNLTDSTIYEGEWLQELFGQTKFSLQSISSDTPLDPNDQLILFMQRPHWSKQLEWAKNLLKQGLTFKIIHCSDEFMQDPVEIYSLPGVEGIIRFYKRSSNLPNTLTIPLGYHWSSKAIKETAIENRLYTWSFTGTDWKQRSTQLEPLLAIECNFVKFFPDWNDPGQLNKDQYLELLQNTIFIPCPEGNNVETYRLYEALECGCIPVFTMLPAVLEDSGIPFLKTETWGQVADLIRYFLENPEQLNTYRDTILESWKTYKAKLKLSIKKWLLL
uniref:Alpha-(1,3)-fucosyltransferase FucT N-terminal domain-containing protein n=1 Tax=viral metagenome TaxID=1070528 RepID=A0A6C0ANR5_9ZZZZ